VCELCATKINRSLVTSGFSDSESEGCSEEELGCKEEEEDEEDKDDKENDEKVDENDGDGDGDDDDDDNNGDDNDNNDRNDDDDGNIDKEEDDGRDGDGDGDDDDDDGNKGADAVDLGQTSVTKGDTLRLAQIDSASPAYAKRKEQRLALKYNVPWQPDSSSISCGECAMAFTLYVRRHHCRNCGKSICSGCSDFCLVTYQAKTKKKRVCITCWHDLNDLNAQKVLDTAHRTIYGNVAPGVKIAGDLLLATSDYDRRGAGVRSALEVTTGISAQVIGKLPIVGAAFQILGAVLTAKHIDIQTKQTCREVREESQK
jgi:hypothetical protein